MGCSSNLNGKVPICNSNAQSYFQISNAGGWDQVIARFSYEGNMKWSTFFGDTGHNGGNALVDPKENHLAVDELDNLYLTSYTDLKVPYPTSQLNNAYLQLTTSLTDYFISRFDENNSLEWSTNFGGYGDELPSDISIDNSDFLYVVGYTDNNNSPYECPSVSNTSPICRSISKGNSDILISKFDMTKVWLGELEIENAPSNYLKLTPNPVADNQIYLEYVSEASMPYIIQVFNQQGVRILESSYSFIEGKNIVDLNLNGLSSGLYIVRLMNQKGGLISGKFVRK